ncbi:MAG: alpha/beta hydrolase [Pseudomonadota bacterium]
MTEPAPDGPLLTLPPGGRLPDRCFWLETPDRMNLRAAIWHAPDPAGHVLFLTGRTEFVEKVAIPAEELVLRGYSVVSLDWRGQGLSSRLLPDPLKGHIDRFDAFQVDLDTLLGSADVASLPGPRVLIAHSMGGCIAAHALQRPEIASGISATILSAPMFGIRMASAMRAAAGATALIARFLGKLDRWPPFGDQATPYVLSGDAKNVLTGDPQVWEWMGNFARDHPEATIAGPTIGWYQAASRAMDALETARPPDHPVLTLLGSDEMVVDPDRIRTRAASLSSKIVEIGVGRHELLIDAEAPRKAAWLAIDDFLRSSGLSTSGG